MLGRLALRSRQLVRAVPRRAVRYVSTNPANTAAAFAHDEIYYKAMTMYEDVEVKYIPGSGRGVFAKKSFKKGDIILTEKSIITAVGNDNVRREEESFCWHCMRPLMGAQIIQADARTKTHIREMGTKGYTEYKATLMEKLHIPKFEHEHIEKSDGVARSKAHFCSPECKHEAVTNYKSLLEREQTIEELLSSTLLMMMSDRDQAFFTTICKIIARTNCYRSPLPDHMPKMVWNPDVLPEGMDQSLHSALLEIFPESKKRFSFNEFLKLKSLIRMNAFAGENHPVALVLKKPVDGELHVQLSHNTAVTVPYIAIAAYGSLFNHSCVPNIQVRVIATTRFIDWVALRDIKKGEELFSCYATIKNKEKRKAYFMEEYGFECKCPLCTSDTDAVAAPKLVKKRKKKSSILKKKKKSILAPYL